MPRFVFALLLICFGLFPKGAVAFGQHSPSEIAYLAMTQGQNLGLRAVLSRLDPVTAPTAVLLARDLGFVGDSPDGQHWRAVHAAPLFFSSSNVNAGFPGSEVRAGALRFTIPERDRAKAGLVVGFTAGGGAGWAIAQGQTLETRAVAQVLYSPQHAVWGYNLVLTGCYRASAQDWRYAGLCFEAMREDRALQVTQSGTARLTLGQVFETVSGWHDISAIGQYGIIQSQDRTLGGTTHSFGQAGVSLRLQSLMPDIGLTSFGVTYGALVQGSHVPHLGAEASIERFLWDRPVRVGISYQISQGGAGLFEERRDQAIRLRIDTRVTRWARLGIGYESRRSNFDAFSSNSVSFNLDLSGLLSGQ